MNHLECIPIMSNSFEAILSSSKKPIQRLSPNNLKRADVPATNFSASLDKVDQKLIQYRAVLSQKVHYRHDKRLFTSNKLQEGVIIGDSSDFYSANIPKHSKKQFRRSLVQQIVSQEKNMFKDRFLKIQQKHQNFNRYSLRKSRNKK